MTGTLWSGTLAAGDRLALDAGRHGGARPLGPGARPAVERAEAGQRVAASLVGVERSAIPAGLEPGHARRTARELPARRRPAGAGGRPRASPTARSCRCWQARPASTHASRCWRRVRWPPGATGLAQLRLREPVTAARGDRVIIRTTAPQATVAGGVVLDPAPRRHGGSERALARLRLLAGGDAPSLVRAALQAARSPARAAADRAARAARAPRGPGRPGRAVRVGRGPPAAGRRERMAHRGALRGAAAAPRGRSSSGAPPSTRSSPSSRRRPSSRRSRRRCAARASRGEGVLQRDGAHVLLAGARADGGGSHAAEAGAVLAALEAGGFTPPDLARAAGRLGTARARVHRALRGARAQREDRPLRRRPRLHERALR